MKMKVLGALEYAEGATKREHYQSVSQNVFIDEEGLPRKFTWRTIESWSVRYRKYGIPESKTRNDKGTMRKVVPEELLEAIEKVLPFFHGKKYNIQQVYRTCIEQGHLRRDQVAPTTFRRYVKKYELLKPEGEGLSKARLAFAKPYANDMWQCDTMHGPYIKIEGKATKTFLISFIDDASRVITHGEFYRADNTLNLLDCLQTALFKRGVPRQMYVDNGSNYCAKEFSLIFNRIGTYLSHTPVRDGAAKGKIERFFKTVRDQFLLRNLSAITSLKELNVSFIDWVENDYHISEHSTLGMKPIDRFGLDLDRIQHHEPSQYNEELFYMETTRKVRVDNTFSFNSIRYEAPRDLRNRSIDLRYNRNQFTATAPIVYQDDERLGAATQVDYIANDRPPKGLAAFHGEQA